MNVHVHSVYNLIKLEDPKLPENYSFYQEIKSSITSDNNVFVFTLFWDIIHLRPHGLIKCVNFLNSISSNKNVKIIFLLTEWLKNKNDFLIFLRMLNSNIEIVYINGIALTAYIELFLEKKCEVNQHWNANTKKFLFLTGKFYKKNRFELFLELEKKGLIDQAIHSLYLPNHYPKNFLDANNLEFITEEQYNFYTKKYNSNPDNARVLKANDQLSVDVGWIHHIGSIPFDSKNYSQTSFRLISETEWDFRNMSHSYPNVSDPWLTEKTWITIFNKHPFIMAGQIQTLKKLSKLGFKTFKNYLPNPNYDMLDDNHRMKAIVENVEFWLNNIEKQSNEIAKDVEFNYNLLIDYCKKDFQKIEITIKNYGLRTSVKNFLGSTLT